MTAKRLLVDVSAAFNQGAGIGRYSRSLLGAVYPTLSQTFDIRLWYAPDGTGVPPYSGDALLGLPEDALARVVRARLSRRRIDQLARLPISIRAEWLTGLFDLCYSPDFTAPGKTDRPVMVTVHDVAFEVVPAAYPPGLLRYLRTVVPLNIRRAARVAVVSRTTRNDVIERYNISPDRVVVIPNAAGRQFFDAVPLAATCRCDLGVPEDYLLAIGTIEPRKNYRTLLDAQRQAFMVTKRPLVIVGRSGWHNHAEMHLITELAETGAVVPLLNARDDLLPGLYAGAHAVAYVPLYEGFGLPVLEAMAAGTPVLASDIPSIREIASGMVEVVQADSVELVTAGLIDIPRATSDESARLRAAARRYSWEQSGTILIDALADLAGGA